MFFLINCYIILTDFFFSLKNRGKVSIMVVSLGSLSLKTETRDENMRNVASMHGSGHTSDHILKTILDRAYDRFYLEIENCQVIFLFE